jgi:hypothetical protein
MRKVKRLLTIAVTMLVFVIFSSSTPARKAVDSVSTETPVASAGIGAKKTIPSSTLTYKDLKAIATRLKGSKLTFKEKLGLKLFGKRIANKAAKSFGYGDGGKSQLTALLLCFFLGCLGIHRFYLGYTWQGIVQLLTLGGCGIWALIDFIRIWTGSLQPKDSEYETTL